jgi:hypothetical protein
MSMLFVIVINIYFSFVYTMLSTYYCGIKFDSLAAAIPCIVRLLLLLYVFLKKSVPSLPRYQLGHRLLVLIATSVYENELRVA